MNYRHAFHAGNFADCMKHALLVWMLRALQRKPAPLFVLDTHAGIGRYDLRGAEAERTGEWREGIGRLLDRPADPGDPLSAYVGLVRNYMAGDMPSYPGSPVLAQSLLRPQDRLACCELHPADHATLEATLDRDRRAAAHHRDGYDAIRALLPPAARAAAPGQPAAPIRRGLVLIDPPFETANEFERLEQAVRDARRRFNTGIVAAWYPIKHRAPARTFLDNLAAAGEPDLVAAELLLRPPLDPQRLNGCGLLVAAPPFGFEEAARDILAALATALGDGEAVAEVRRVTPEGGAAR
ncbi:23S rRNA (adenine(2030)-N(6))-methyltransferase RlmJ [Rhizosaccharibacter radicis]|uniref:Ribosomal RNA large subunit methyltransferase J n=1 Tax=Rhizosaccharibacter radicis TaxID=2782605 RepID=A0ABT1VYG4_9PROT|nr:23S rRNA (adenine(2030)-N(6))-methyltransferase RlmJ [Acetobacteraceae bacterium KSS12]